MSDLTEILVFEKLQVLAAIRGHVDSEIYEFYRNHVSQYICDNVKSPAVREKILEMINDGYNAKRIEH